MDVTVGELGILMCFKKAHILNSGKKCCQEGYKYLLQNVGGQSMLSDYLISILDKF